MWVKGFALTMLLITASNVTTAQERPPQNHVEAQLSYAPVVRESAPAVVNIYATWVVERRASPFANDPFFSQFFNNLAPTVPRMQNSLGSGVIIDGSGIVVSNHHVVQDATEIRVVLSDRREFDGQVLLSDEGSDIAVIQLDGAQDLPALGFANSDLAEVGDLVLAIGNPFGVGQTVSSGIVSATARTGAATGQGSGYFLQTDAPINPGNSGGALVDMEGHLLGLNTSILTRSGGSNGIGFAIPSNLVAEYVRQAIAGETDFVEPWAGVAVQTVDSGLAEALGITPPSGVLVTETHPESTFAARGLAPGDVIVAIDGHPVDTEAALHYRLLTRGAVGTVSLTYQRDGGRETLDVPISEAPGREGAETVRVDGTSPFAGLVLADVTPRMIQKLDLPLSTKGVVVMRADGPSARLGLRGGDMIRQLNGKQISDAETLVEIVERGAAIWEMELRRGNRALRLRIRG